MIFINIWKLPTNKLSWSTEPKTKVHIAIHYNITSEMTSKDQETHLTDKYMFGRP